MDLNSLKESFVQSFHKNVYGSEPLQTELNVEDFGRNDIIVCDFFPIVEKWHECFVMDDETDSEYPLFTSNAIEEMRRDVLKYVSSFSNCSNEKRVICLCGLFKKSEGSSDMLVQRFNWVLEEIYGMINQNFDFTYMPLKIPYFESFSSSIKTFYHDNATKLNDAILNLAKELREQIGFYVSAAIENNILTSEVVLEKTNEQAEHFFYLLRDGKIIDRQGWFKENKFQWSLKENGSYCVQGYVRQGKFKSFQFSKPLVYFNEAMRKEFENFMNEEPEGTAYRKTLPFHQLSAPFADILIVSSSHLPKDKVKRFCQDNPWLSISPELLYAPYSAFVLSNGGQRMLPSGELLVFSGITMLDNQITIGLDEIPADATFETLASGYGNFNLVFAGKDSLRISTDYFNYSRWFYMDCKDFFVISNRYHLMLLFLRHMGINLQLDKRKAAITLSTVTVMPLNNSFSRKMDMEGIFQLENDKTLRLASSGWQWECTDFGRVLEQDEVFHENLYLTLLNKASDEVKRNVRAGLESPKFKHVTVDLSGGLDSRLVYAALTTIRREDTKKVRIISNDVAGSHDLQIATEINSIYGFEYDDLPVKIQSMSFEEADDIIRSFFLGTYYSYFPFSTRIIGNDTLNLNGACGEILYRPDLARKYFNKNAIDVNAESLASYLWHDFAANIAVADEESESDFISLIAEELNQYPVKTVLEAYDRYYLQNRNGYHFDESLRFRYTRKTWMPLQSKTAFRLHHMTFSVFKSIKLQLDMIGSFNPLLLAIRFDSERDNQDLEQLKDELAPVSSIFSNIHICGKNDTERWENARKKKNSSTIRLQAAESGIAPFHTGQKDLQEYVLVLLKDSLRELLQREPDIKKRCGLALYYYITIKSNDLKKIRYYYNKVTSLLDQIRIFD